MTKFLLAALLGAFILSSVANAADVTPANSAIKKNKVETKIDPIRIAPKQDRGIASEDDGFVPVPSPAYRAVTKQNKKSAEKRKPACAGSKCPKIPAAKKPAKKS